MSIPLRLRSVFFLLALAILISGTLSIRLAKSHSAAQSATPTDADIFRCRIFQEPLVPIGGKTTAEENAALCRAIDACKLRKDQDDYSAILDFLSAHPRSAWRVGLLTNLGLDYRHTGWFLRALDAFRHAWELGKNEKSAMGKGVADRAVGELAELNARLGRWEQVEGVLKQIEGRPLIGPASEKITAAREGVWLMLNRPGEAFKCGPYALDRILALKGSDPRNRSKIIEAQSTDHGMSLDQVWQLSKELGMNFQMAKRAPGSQLIIPSVVNWKANHYGALVREDRSRFLIQDLTFDGDILVTKAALDSESSGYFLVPLGQLPEGWKEVGSEEAKKVWGMGSTADHDPFGTKSFDEKAKPACATSGMAVYNFHMQPVSLNIMDTPVGYTPARGPDMHVTLTYNQREYEENVNHAFGNFGGTKWVCNWISYLDGNPANGYGAPVRVHIPGGGVEFFVSQSAGSYPPAAQSGAMLLVFDNPSPPEVPRFERVLPDGSRQVFELSSYDTFHGSTHTYMTKWIDPSGNTVHFNYDTDFRLTSVTDALNQSTAISYLSNNSNVLPDFYLISQITDPFNRSATFEYQDSQLIKIHDAVGITSQFAYVSGGDFINAMTTPYGTTTFSQPSTLLNNSRTIQAVEPDSGIVRVEYGEMAIDNTVIPAMEPLMPDVSSLGIHPLNGYYCYRNSFYFDKKATSLYPPDENGRIALSNYSKAKLIHWFHHQIDERASNIKEREKQPLENAVYFFYPGQSDEGYGRIHDSATGVPSVVARRLDNGSSGVPPVTQIYQFDYNSVNKVTRAIDAKERVTTFKYDTNNIDLLYVYQERTDGVSTDPFGAPADLLTTYSNYTMHRPQNVVDAAGQPTTYTYNSYGQVLAVQDAKGETTTYAYGDGSAGKPIGYVTSITSPTFNGSSAATSFTYDSANRVQKVKYVPDDYETTTSYDSLDRPTQISYPDGTNQQFQYSQDFGQGLTTILDLTKSKDRRGRWTSRHYTANRQMDSITDPLNRITQYNWCTCGSLVSITDPRLKVTTFNRDLQSRVISKQFDDHTLITYVYENTTSRLKSTTDALNQTTNYSYFADDSLQQVSYTNALNLTPTVSYAYDPNYNRVASMTDGTGITHYNYYPVTPSPTLGANQLYQVDGPLSNDTITYTYDELGRVLSQGINGTTASTTYDSLGRLDATTNALGSFSRSYNGVTPRLQTLTYPNGQTANYTYFGNSQDRRLQTLQNKRSTNANISKFDYTYDAEGEIQSWNRTLATTETDRTFTYDDADQLLRMHQGLQNYDYSYDLSGNRLTDKVSSFTIFGKARIYTANDLNQLDSLVVQTGHHEFSNPVALTYDANGNMTYDAGNKTFEWDAANRLIAINYKDSGNRTEFAYDGLGRRVKITEYGPAVTAVVESKGGDYVTFTTAPFTLTTGEYALKFEGLNPNGGNNTAFIDAITLNGALVANGGFENPVLTEDAIAPSGSGWNWTGSAGIAVQGGGLIGGGPNPPEGGQAAFVTNTGSLWQMGSVTAGIYNLGFFAAQRASGNDSAQQLLVNMRGATSTKRFVWSGNTIAEERDSTGANVTKRFFAEGEQRVTGGNVENFYYSRDHLGSIREVTMSDGIVRGRYDYDAWGNLVASEGKVSVDFGYTGHYFHQPSGMNFTLNRIYNPPLARWMTRDPLQNAEMSQGANLYAYVGNDPTGRRDPLGLYGTAAPATLFLGPQTSPLWPILGAAGLGAGIGTAIGYPIGQIDLGENWRPGEKVCDLAADSLIEGARWWKTMIMAGMSLLSGIESDPPGSLLRGGPRADQQPPTPPPTEIVAPASPTPSPNPMFPLPTSSPH